MAEESPLRCPRCGTALTSEGDGEDVRIRPCPTCAAGDDLARDIDYALRHKLVPKIKWKDENTSRRAAEAILEHMRLCGWEFTRREPQKQHRTP